MRINFQDFVFVIVFVGFVYYFLFRKMAKIIQKLVIVTILD